MTPLPCTPDVEQPQPDEQEAIEGTIRGMTGQSRTVERRDGWAVRAGLGRPIHPIPPIHPLPEEHP